MKRTPVSIRGAHFEADDSAGPHADTEGLEPYKVLIVDDETHILKAVQRLFLGQGYEVLSAPSGADAVELFREHQIAVIISDQRMPGLSGAALLNYVRKKSPHTVRIMLTGNNDVATAIEAINQGEVFRFITKPWDHDEFLKIVGLAIEHHELLISRVRYQEHIREQNERLSVLNTELSELNEELEARVEARTQEVVARQREIERLYCELQGSFDATIKALVSIMELGEVHVIEHCQRTAERVRMFGERLGLDTDEIQEVERATLLHWIGLINAPPRVFELPVEELDEEAKASWEFHTVLGQQAIQHVPALRQAGRMILHYLNRYDAPEFQPGRIDPSSGDVYQESFVRGCRILGICSAFERVRTGLRGNNRLEVAGAVERGLQLLQKGAGTRYDPELVRQFREMVAQEMATARTREIVVSFENLRPGMVLARPLETAQGIPVAPRDMIITDELIARLGRFQDSNGLNEIRVWG
ncbi:response regulator [Lujinxingia litoralis]|nr:response regulator [Lujinxingia litoralis]